MGNTPWHLADEASTGTSFPVPMFTETEMLFRQVSLEHPRKLRDAPSDGHTVRKSCAVKSYNQVVAKD